MAIKDCGGTSEKMAYQGNNHDNLLCYLSMKGQPLCHPSGTVGAQNSLLLVTQRGNPLRFCTQANLQPRPVVYGTESRWWPYYNENQILIETSSFRQNSLLPVTQRGNPLRFCTQANLQPWPVVYGTESRLWFYYNGYHENQILSEASSFRQGHADAL